MASHPIVTDQYLLCEFKKMVTYERNNTVANTLLLAIVESGGVVVGSVVPDRNRVLQVNDKPLLATRKEETSQRTFSHLNLTWRSWLS